MGCLTCKFFFEAISLIVFVIGSYILAFSAQGCACTFWPEFLRVRGVTVLEAFQTDPAYSSYSVCQCSADRCGEYNLGCIVYYSNNISATLCNYTLCVDVDGEGSGIYDASQLMPYEQGWYLGGSLIVIGLLICLIPRCYKKCCKKDVFRSLTTEREKIQEASALEALTELSNTSNAFPSSNSNTTDIPTYHAIDSVDSYPYYK